MQVLSSSPTRPRNLLLTAAFFGAILPVAASAQSFPQPYNSQDPQNYSSPASQTYQAQYPQQGYPAQQQGAYPGQQQPYPQQQGGYGDPNQQGGYGDPSQQQNAAPYAGQQLVPQAPPALPEYDQPEAPGEGYIWTPGYWAWGPGGYYWVAGQWTLPPYEGALYTPGYWGDYDGGYFWNAGYWGPVVGFYGGINYGFGYFGTGFYGGYWRGGRFCYNRLYNHLGPGFRGGYYVQRVGGFNPGYHFGGGRAYTAVNVSRGFAGGYRGGQAPVGRGFASGGQFAGGPQRIQGDTHGVTTIQGSGIRTQGFATPGNPNQFRPAQSYGNPGNFSHGAAPSQPAPQFHAQPSGNIGGNFRAPSGGFSGAAQPHFSGGVGGGGFHGGGGGGHR